LAVDPTRTSPHPEPTNLRRSTFTPCVRPLRRALSSMC
jgi:hypothetical protein